MTYRQRIILVVAWGAIMAIAAVTVNRLLAHEDGGWFAYAPNTGVAFSPGGTSAIWRECLVWVGAVALWVGPSYWIVRARQRSGRRRSAA